MQANAEAYRYKLARLLSEFKSYSMAMYKQRDICNYNVLSAV